MPSLKVVGVDQPVAVGAAQTRLLALRLQVTLDGKGKAAAGGTGEHPQHDEHGMFDPGTHKIEFIIQAVNDDQVTRHEKSSFIIPH